MSVWPGNPQPLGAHWDGLGTNFALASERATSVRLCLFDSPGDAEPAHETRLSRHEHGVWHAYLPEVQPSQVYGYRVDGPWEPEVGNCFNPAKLLLDPYGRAIAGNLHWDSSLAGARPDGRRDLSDSAPYVPRSVVIDSSFPWGDDRPPRTPWSRTVLYECHVKGMTALHPEVPEEQRGTFRGLASEPVIDHLLDLGVTAVELLPVQHRVSEAPLVRRGLDNYWGYNPVGFFAPDSRFAQGDTGEQVLEFKQMVRSFHLAGIEVILDVVFNHTAEGGADGPVLCWRGLDDRATYHRDPTEPTRYANYTGCGNSVDASNPRTLQQILDCLRYWVEEMHVDGFRFDLAPTLSRQSSGELQVERFFALIEQDPVLAPVKRIAEPWDLGPDGYSLGRFPGEWSEWNDSYRTAVRRFWRGDEGVLGAFASAVSGSAPVFEPGDRLPSASINMVTSHDGFTLRDWVSYEERHNEANGEENRDGSTHNWSRNWGVEGPTDDEGVETIRGRLARCMLATLTLSQGVPMLLHGDELSRTQRGNNNAYCQDNEISWLDWSQEPDDPGDLRSYVARLLDLRSESPLLRRPRFFDGELDPETGEKDVIWLRPDGEEMKGADWEAREAHSLGMWIPHGPNRDEDERGQLIAAETLLLIFNAARRGVRFRLPDTGRAGVWRRKLCSCGSVERLLRSSHTRVPAQCVTLLSFQESP
ncbi:MAG: glycogen debranching protein GlgX [Myxococcota bacterium]|nr:glycogen debranching protein GlgX [Myxococcota bacterium]